MFARNSTVVLLSLIVAACAPRPGEKLITAGYNFSALGEWGKSISSIDNALKVAEDDEVRFLAYGSRCNFKIWDGRLQDALNDCNASIRTKPGYYGLPYASRARIFATMGRYAWAMQEFDIAIDLGGSRNSPVADNPRIIGLGGKARILATSNDDKKRNAELAVQFAEKAVELERGLSSPSHIILNLDTLAAAYAEAGRFDDAIKTQQKTIERTKSNKWDAIRFGRQSIVNMLSDHLKLFQNGKPLRGGVY